jgi:hypothetical protein
MLSRLMYLLCLLGIPALFAGCACSTAIPCRTNDDCQANYVCTLAKCEPSQTTPPGQTVKVDAYGTQACEEATPQGAAGIRTIRFALEQSALPSTAFIGSDSFKLTSDQLAVDGTPQVFDKNGQDVSDKVSVVITMQKGSVAVPFHVNPHYQALLKTAGNKRVPRAISLTMDMSETAADQDPKMSRTAAPASWVLERFNTDSTRGDLDVLSALMFRSGTISAADLLFRTWEAETQFIAADGRQRGYVISTNTNVERASRTFTTITNSSVNGLPPVYQGVQVSALDLRNVAWDSDNGDQLFVPGIIALLAERDLHLLDSKQPNAYPDAFAALQGKAQQSIPFFPILYPKPDKTPDANWKSYQIQLCQLTLASGDGNKGGWGQLIQLPPNARQQYTTNVRSALDFATIAMSGFFETKLNYTITGGNKGETYWVSFKLKINHPNIAPTLTSNKRGTITFAIQQ